MRTVKQYFIGCGVASQGLAFCCSIFSNCLEPRGSGAAGQLGSCVPGRSGSQPDSSVKGGFALHLMDGGGLLSKKLSRQ